MNAVVGLPKLKDNIVIKDNKNFGIVYRKSI